MIPVKSQQKYKCNFCKKRGIKRKMEFHEINCYRNSKRLCSYCKNVGWKYESAGDDNDTQIKVDCPYCGAFSKTKLKEIEKYEKEKNMVTEVLKYNPVPF